MKDFLKGKFVYGGKPLEDGPSWAMTTLKNGTMRFRWNEDNSNRRDYFTELFGSSRSVVPVELIHSKIIYDIENSSATLGKQGDGIITCNRNLVPAVTVADCLPAFIYDLKSGCFGALHSGWKGTGIAAEAVKKICTEHDSTPENICIVLGPHIESCCYNITADRAKYFIDNFSPDCVELKNDGSGVEYMLSLEKANLASLHKAGVPQENILSLPKCTCCHKENGEYEFGSFRRQTSTLPQDMDLEERMKLFTVQAAFVWWPEN